MPDDDIDGVPLEVANDDIDGMPCEYSTPQTHVDSYILMFTSTTSVHGHFGSSSYGLLSPECVLISMGTWKTIGSLIFYLQVLTNIFALLESSRSDSLKLNRIVFIQ